MSGKINFYTPEETEMARQIAQIPRKQWSEKIRQYLEETRSARSYHSFWLKVHVLAADKNEKSKKEENKSTRKYHESPTASTETMTVSKNPNEIRFRYKEIRIEGNEVVVRI